MYNLIEYRDNYSKTFGSLRLYRRDKPALDNGNIADFTNDNVTDSFKFNQQMIDQTGDNGT